jgi:hypothetical protein
VAGPCDLINEDSAFIKGGTLFPVERLLASQEGLFSMTLLLLFMSMG